jgi:hypothetical protein
MTRNYDCKEPVVETDHAPVYSRIRAFEKIFCEVLEALERDGASEEFLAAASYCAVIHDGLNF